MMFNQCQIRVTLVQLSSASSRPGKFGASHVFATLKRLELEESLRSF